MHTRRRTSFMRVPIAALALAGVLIGGLSTGSPAAADIARDSSQSTAFVSPSSIVQAADLSQFRPGNIISNEVFFNSGAMSEAEIAEFLRQRVPNCQSGHTCLKDYQQNTATRAGDAYCSTYPGGSSESAARIIFKVAQACGINPQVILVTLQKEQGLVTHTWPSEWRYTIAMGQGCPDTAACDTRYYGFYNQVLGAARQFLIYSANTYFTYYAPGKTWNVLFHPNRACGSSPVYIENQATANLYYYTPYQPNPAALRAGYGEGDGCSSYGNRNFYNYFTDWFGSTQTSNMTLVKLATDSTVWFVNNGSRWHVGNVEDYVELSRVYGGARVVGETFIASMTYRGATGAVLREASTGTISIIQEGQRHRITSCETVADLGSSCTAPVNVTSALLSRVPTGADVGAFFRVRGTQRWGRFEDSRAVTPLYNASAARAVNGDVRTTPYAPYLNSDLYAAAPKRPTVFAPAQLVKASNDATVYLTVDFDKLAHVTSWASVVDYNRRSTDLAVVAPGELSGYSVVGAVQPALSCAGTTYLVAAGWLNRVADAPRAAMPEIVATAATCAQFSQRPNAISGSVAIKTADAAEVWVIEGGKRRLASTWASLVANNGGTPPTIVTVNAGTRDALPEGAVLFAGSVVKTATSPDLLLSGGASTYRIPSLGLAADLGIVLNWRTITDVQAAALPRGHQLSSWTQCGATVYFGAEGRLWAVTPEVAVGFAPSQLDSAACWSLRRDASTLGLVAVKAAGSSDVLVASAGRLRHVTSWDALVRLNGGTAPRVLTVSLDALRAIPAGDPIN